MKSTKKDAEDIFEIIRFGRISKTSFTDTVSIVIRVAYRTSVFRDTNNIKIAY